MMPRRSPRHRPPSSAASARPPRLGAAASFRALRVCALLRRLGEEPAVITTMGGQPAVSARSAASSSRQQAAALSQKARPRGRVTSFRSEFTVSSTISPRASGTRPHGAGTCSRHVGRCIAACASPIACAGAGRVGVGARGWAASVGVLMHARGWRRRRGPPGWGTSRCSAAVPGRRRARTEVRAGGGGGVPERDGAARAERTVLCARARARAQHEGAARACPNRPRRER